MEATVSSPWSKPGAWALEAEENESELQSQNEVADFPSLSAATKQPKKKKTQTVSLAEFHSPQPSGLTHDEILSLPTGPRQRAPEELDRNRLGGGFKLYGANSRISEDSSSSRCSRGARESNRELPPSRADEIDDWSKAKKSSGLGLGFERRERERGSSLLESHSRADESDNWASNKSVETRRFSGGSSFDRRGSFDSLSRGREGERNNFGGSDSYSWMKKDGESSDGAAGGARPKLVLQPRTLPVNEEGNAAKPKGSNPFGDARPREEVLAEKGMDHKEIDERLEAMKINENGNAKEGETGRRGSDSGSRWSFGSFGSERGVERAWRKPDAAESSSSPQSAEKTEEK